MLGAIPHLGVIAFLPFVIFVTLVIVFSSNAVNLTDGLDGLAIGCTIIAAAALTVIVLLVPVMLVVTVSVAVIVWLPAVLSVALKVPVPLVSVLLAGRLALPSLLVKCTVPE